MTLHEARILARIIGSADGGCSVCVRQQVEQFNSAGFGFTLIQTDKELWGRSPYEEGEKSPLGIAYLAVEKEEESQS